MWASQHLVRRNTASQYRLLSHIATATLSHEPIHFSYDNVEGLPKPDPKLTETIFAIPRIDSSKRIRNKERKSGRIPSFVFEQANGQDEGNKWLVSVKNAQFRKFINHVGFSVLLSRLFDLEVRADFDSDEIIKKVQVLLWKVLYS